MSETAGVAISLFSGCGGLDRGVEGAGFRVAAAVEIDRDAADTMEKNFHGLQRPVIRQDLREVSADELLQAAGLHTGERPDLLVGGPPCIAFSKSGFWLDYKREGLDPAAGLLKAYTRVLRETRPRAFLLENVYALTFKNRASRPAFEQLLQEIANAGYQHRWGVLNAANHGVPQLRPRLFVVGVPKGQPLPELPAPTHGGRWEGTRTGNLAQPHVTAGQAFDGLVSEPEAGEKWRGRYWNFLLKLSPDRPAPTIQAQPGPYVGPFHWENRRLRVAELKRLFSYPDDFVFVGSRKSVQAQIGNSVPPLVARAVAKTIGRVL